MLLIALQPLGSEERLFAVAAASGAVQVSAAIAVFLAVRGDRWKALYKPVHRKEPTYPAILRKLGLKTRREIS